LRPVLAWLVAAGVSAAILLGAADRLPASVTGRVGSVAETFVTWDVADSEVTDANFATVERVAHWQAAAAMWADSPWVGQGPGHYELVYDRYRLPRWPDALGHAHNYYLHVLAETGIIGLATYLAFIGAALVFTVRAALRPATRLQAALGLGLVGVFGAVVIHSLTDNVFVHDMTVHLGLLIGLTHAAGAQS
jgi:O-antigen ligase